MMSFANMGKVPWGNDHEWDKFEPAGAGVVLALRSRRSGSKLRSGPSRQTIAAPFN
jgi:hypothetical protein